MRLKKKELTIDTHRKQLRLQQNFNTCRLKLASKKLMIIAVNSKYPSCILIWRNKQKKQNKRVYPQNSGLTFKFFCKLHHESFYSESTPRSMDSSYKKNSSPSTFTLDPPYSGSSTVSFIFVAGVQSLVPAATATTVPSFSFPATCSGIKIPAFVCLAAAVRLTSTRWPRGVSFFKAGIVKRNIIMQK